MSDNRPAPYLEPISHDEALEMTRGEFHDFIQDHPGQSYLIRRTMNDRIAVFSEGLGYAAECTCGWVCAISDNLPAVEDRVFTHEEVTGHVWPSA